MEKYQEDIVGKALELILEKTASKFKKIVKDKWEKFKTDYMIVFHEYYKSAYEKYSKAKTIIYRAEPMPLIGNEGFFENPYIFKGYLNEEMLQYHFQHSYHDDNRFVYVKGINTIISLKTHYMMLQGTGGIGKSTLMKFLFLDTLADKGYVPVFVDLREINDLGEKYDLKDFLFKKLYSLGSTLDPEYMDRTLSSGMYVFFLDGYDEILIGKRDIFNRKLEEFICLYRENYYILSSRPYSSFAELHRFTIYSLCPFVLRQALSQIKKLHFDTNIKGKFMMALKDGLYKKHRDFASNPLLLSIMLLTYEYYAEVPDKLHIFYSEAFDTMYSRHDAINNIYRRPRQCELSYDEFKNALAHFCFCTYVKGKIEFRRDEIKRVFINTHYSFDVDDFINDLQNVLCIIVQDGLGYTFSHRSFQEYFAAFYLKEMDDARMKKCGIKMVTTDPRLLLQDNVFSMLADMTRERFLKNLLLPFFEKIDTSLDSIALIQMFHLVDKRVFFQDQQIEGMYKNPKITHRLILQPNDKSDVYCPLITFVCEHLIKSDDELSEWNNELMLYKCMHGTITAPIKGNSTVVSLMKLNDEEIEYFKQTRLGRAMQYVIEQKKCMERSEEDIDAFLDKILEIT